MAPHRVRQGGTVKVSGRNLADVRAVIFYGRSGRGDDVRSVGRRPRSTSVAAAVPEKARSGPVGVLTDAGVHSRRWESLLVEKAARTPGAPRATGPEPLVQGARSEPRTIFYGGLQSAVFTYQISNSRPIDVGINLIREADGVIVRTWQEPQVQPGVPHQVVWNGLAQGSVQPVGRYSFRVTAAYSAATQAGGLPEAGQGAEDGPSSVVFYDHMFPIRGKHAYSGPAGRFGAGREGHAHQGQDVFAACGSTLVAARGGKVAYSGYHALAGYYVVIDGKGTRVDYVYMHLRDPALVKAGDPVYTGQQIGEVGQTGNARACHLHFELWSAPGWYQGGRPFDPLRSLKSWDSFD